MPGDLNLKKSWNPALIKNQAKVWKQEQKQLEEFNKIKVRQQELEAEKSDLQLINLKYKNKDAVSKEDKLKMSKLDWMYEGEGEVLGGVGDKRDERESISKTNTKTNTQENKTNIKEDTNARTTDEGKDVRQGINVNSKLKKSEIDELDPMSQIRRRYLEKGDKRQRDRSGEGRESKRRHRESDGDHKRGENGEGSHRSHSSSHRSHSSSHRSHRSHDHSHRSHSNRHNSSSSSGKPSSSSRPNSSKGKTDLQY